MEKANCNIVSHWGNCCKKNRLFVSSGWYSKELTVVTSQRMLKHLINFMSHIAYTNVILCAAYMLNCRSQKNAVQQLIFR